MNYKPFWKKTVYFNPKYITDSSLAYLAKPNKPKAHIEVYAKPKFQPIVAKKTELYKTELYNVLTQDSSLSYLNKTTKTNSSYKKFDNHKVKNETNNNINKDYTNKKEVVHVIEKKKFMPPYLLYKESEKKSNQVEVRHEVTSKPLLYRPYLIIHNQYLSCLTALRYWLKYLDRKPKNVLYLKWSFFIKAYTTFLRLYYFFSKAIKNFEPKNDILKKQAVDEFLDYMFPNIKELDGIINVLCQLYEYIFFIKSAFYFIPYQPKKLVYNINKLTLKGYVEEILTILTPHITYLTNLMHKHKRNNYYAPINPNKAYAEKKYKQYLSDNLRLFKEKKGKPYTKYLYIRHNFFILTFCNVKIKKLRKRK